MPKLNSTTEPSTDAMVLPASASRRGAECLGAPKLAKSAAPSEAAEPPRVADVGSILEAKFRYRLEKRLGSGGFGSVFLATCLDSNPGVEGSPPDEVAIKILGNRPDGQARSSLKRELSAMRSLDHHRTPQLYDWKLDGDCAYVVLEYFAAGSLADARRALGRLDEAQTWRLLNDLLSALADAHRSSILHLDVKPSNVLLDQEGGFVLTDFGVSHSSRMSKGLLHQGQIPIGLGTHGFRAPEQADMAVQSFDLRTDLWGVGATAWSMYTGIDLNKRPDVLRRPEDGNIYGLQLLSDVHLACPPPLEEVIMGLLYIDPNRRPGGAAEVQAQIQAITSGFGIEPRPYPKDRASRPTLSREIQRVVDALVDPLWASMCRTPGFERFFAKFEHGSLISNHEVRAHHCFLALSGRVRVEVGNRVVAHELPEGNLLCAISTLTGAARQVSLRAEGEVWACIFNEAELEQLVTCNPSVAVRMIRSMATRIASSPPRHRD